MEYLRKDFMSNVSHEFKTPIVSIQGFAELIKNQELPPEKFEEYTDIIIEEAKRLNHSKTARPYFPWTNRSGKPSCFWKKTGPEKILIWLSIWAK